MSEPTRRTVRQPAERRPRRRRDPGTPSATPDLAVLIPDLEGGGAQRATVAIVNALADRGLSIELVCGNAVGPNLTAVDPAVRVVDLGRRRFRWTLTRMIAYLRRRRPIALMGVLTQANLVACLAARLAAWRGFLVVNERSRFTARVATPSVWWERTLPWILRGVYRRADAVVAVSQGVADDLADFAPELADRITAIPNPVDVQAITEAARAPTGHPWADVRDVPFLLHVGRLAPQKNVEVTIRAFATVSAMRSARLLVLGEGPERPQLEDLTERLGIRSVVDFVGYVDPPYPFMARASALILASRYEGWPNVLVEALASGCPVVATDCPSGPSEILAKGRFGHLVPVDDRDRLAEAIIRTLDDPPGASQLRQRAQHWAPKRIADAYLDVLRTEPHS